jgi:transposase-like protein
MNASIRKRRKIDASLKAKVAIAAIRGEQTTAQISSTHGVHSSQIAQWKKQLMDALPDVFSRSDKSEGRVDEKLTAALYEEIGRLKVELDWLKKRL